MAEIEWEGYFPEPKRVQYELTRMDNIGVLTFPFVPTKWAKVILPDEINVEDQDSVKTDLLPNEAQQSDFFKGFSYHLVRTGFAVIPGDWKKTQSLTLTLTIQHTQESSVVVYVPAIFPIDNAVQIGDVAKEYQIMYNLSVKTANVQIPVYGFNIGLVGGIDLSKKELRKVSYPLQIPEVLAGTGGNNEAGWKFYQNEALKPQGQYRADMIVGFPQDKSKNYQLKIELKAAVKNAFDPKPIIHTAPLRFR